MQEAGSGTPEVPEESVEGEFKFELDTETQNEIKNEVPEVPEVPVAEPLGSPSANDLSNPPADGASTPTDDESEQQPSL
jgi:hypothetical protein